MEFAGIDKFLLWTFVMVTGGEIAAKVIEHRRKNPKIKYNRLANAREGEKEELNDLLGQGIQIADDVMLDQKTTFEGCVIFGPTGSGKTTSFFFPNLLQNKIRGSILVTDPKGELYEKTSEYQRNVCRRKVIKFSPLEPKNTYRYNILSNCKNSTEVVQLSALLLINGALSIELQTGKQAGGIEWIQMSEPLLAAAMLYTWHLNRPYNTVENAFNLIINHDPNQLDFLINNCGYDDVKQQYNIFKTVGGSDKTIGSIKITLASNMKLFCDNDINKTNSLTDFTAESLREKETIIYVTYPERKCNYIAPYIAPFFSQIIDKLIDCYTEGSLPITFFFDEFANIGMINNLSTNLATVRSRKMSMNICLQSKSQLVQIYGSSTTQSILNNLKTKIVLPGLADLDTLKYISELCGKTSVEIQSESESNNDGRKSKTVNRSWQTKDLFTIDEIRTLTSVEEIILMHNRQPIRAIQNIYYNKEKYLVNVLESEKRSFNHYYSDNNFEKFIENKLMDYSERKRSFSRYDEVFK